MSIRTICKRLNWKKIGLWALAILPFAVCLSIPIAIASGDPVKCIACRATAAITRNPLVKFCK